MQSIVRLWLVAVILVCGCASQSPPVVANPPVAGPPSASPPAAATSSGLSQCTVYYDAFDAIVIATVPEGQDGPFGSSVATFGAGDETTISKPVDALTKPSDSSGLVFGLVRDLEASDIELIKSGGDNAPVQLQGTDMSVSCDLVGLRFMNRDHEIMGGKGSCPHCVLHFVCTCLPEQFQFPADPERCQDPQAFDPGAQITCQPAP